MSEIDPTDEMPKLTKVKSEDGMKIVYPDQQTEYIKRCNHCKQLLPRTSEFFYVVNHANDGLGGTCKDCTREKKSSKQSREQLAAYKRDYRSKNPDLVREQAHRRRTRKVNAEGDFTSADVSELYDLQDGRCAYCGMPVLNNYHVDHMTPLVRGGSNWPENLAITCPDCNTSKNDKTADEFLAILNRRIS